jgi:hypothetical protein
MIQRIQSVYLFLIVILAGLTIGLPVASLINVKSNLLYIMDIRGISLIQPTGVAVFQSATSMLTTFAAVFGTISLIIIFSYKNRVKQIRLSVLNFLFMIGYYVALIIYIWMACSSLSTEWHLRIAAIFPIISMILNYLAIGAIGKDEKLVKSLDRIR